MPRRLAFALMLVPLAVAHADTVIFGNGVNNTLGTAQPMINNPDLIIHQAPPNFTLATAQPVSPAYQASEALGAVTSSQPQQFYSFAASDGQNISLRVDASNPSTQFPELLLYDPNGNLVAIANGNASNGSSSVIDFTVPSGDGGNWTAQVVGSPSVPNPATNLFNYDLKLTGSVITYSTDVLGALNDLNKPGFYALDANAGDNLHLFVKAGTPSSQFPELLLYDPNGNLVAIANGNAADGSSSVIDFTVPGGDSGAWTAEVSTVAGTLFNYDLLIQGDTGVGPIDPIALATAVPEPSTMAFLAASLAGLTLVRRRRNSTC
ncbi:MAG TPA: pre-peptidase C-terminal domain-containing protein [Bryobacteraceae bacterium]|nr:pre-peptidase C-terminal domain-containing protein [Bryobacteraceae bacterium]